MPSSMRRTTELGLIILAALIIVGADGLGGPGSPSSIPPNLRPFLGILPRLRLLPHPLTRPLPPRADALLLPLAALLNGLGYVFIARLDEDLAAYQAAWTGLGIA